MCQKDQKTKQQQQTPSPAPQKTKPAPEKIIKATEIHDRLVKRGRWAAGWLSSTVAPGRSATRDSRKKKKKIESDLTSAGVGETNCWAQKIFSVTGVLPRGTVETNLTRNHEVVGLIPGLGQ